MELMAGNRQLVRRPADERFSTPQDMIRALAERDARVYKTDIDNQNDISTAVSGDTIECVAKNMSYKFTPWSLSQFCKVSDAPYGYIQRLPASIASAALNVTKDLYKRGTVLWLLKSQQEGGKDTVRALLSNTYSRLKDSKVATDILEFSDGFSHKGLYGSDRDAFWFFINENDRIEVEGESLGRGFFCWNSEVGSKSFGYQTFLFNYVCANHIVWGAKDVVTINRRHVGDMDKVRENLRQAIVALADRGKKKQQEEIIRKAITTTFAANDETAAERLVELEFTKKAATKIVEESYNHKGAGAGLTVWGILQGATSLSKEISYMEDRIDFERQASKILQFV